MCVVDLVELEPVGDFDRRCDGGVVGLSPDNRRNGGSVSERYVKCNKAGCACADDTDARHGPYYSGICLPLTLG